ncbi:MAG: UPF0262 family protein [Pseudomonadota bacterium]|nr:UPF0262 family protein [Pseudomonadota bacterium]
MVVSVCVSEEKKRLFDVSLEDQNFGSNTPKNEHERRVAISDLLKENRFWVIGDNRGPYSLRLLREDNRLNFEITAAEGSPVSEVPVSLGRLRKIIRDYSAICETYYGAIKTTTPAKLEVIDMGRRGLHDEAAALLRGKLEKWVDIDQRTARGLFTLICVLYART